ncbi:DUF6086 family protein [Kitasatospora sp. NPDC006697]|uniref:DUF6086 family protein n=1 Tax=Kitasatospora sp. NPDC006697 TaxID=3364020 RepID=UPI00368CBA1B
MSQYYELDGTTLWNAATGVSRLFLRQLAVFEAELGLPSGIGPMYSDECRIAPAELAPFADAVLAHHQRTRHPVIRALSGGFTATLLALAERAGAAPDLTPHPELRAMTRELSRTMAR